LEILLSIFKNINENDNLFINEKSKEFNSSFQDMMVKLSKAEINFKSNKLLSSIKIKSNNTNSFIKFPEKIEPSKQKDMKIKQF